MLRRSGFHEARTVALPAVRIECELRYEQKLSADVGERKISRIRMYAGGNITKIPFPARPEIAELKGKKVQLREELGLDKDRFTVSLSDGGYGMARLGDTVEAILERADLPITVVALCGTNEELCKRLTELAKSLKP